MLKWLQIRAIVDRLTGQETAPRPLDDFDEPWRTIYGRAYPCEEPRLVIWDAVKGLPDAVEAASVLLDALSTADTPAESPTLSELAGDLRAIEWVWPGWIPRGFLSLLGADPGAGKSLLALDLARRIIHGLPFPDAASAAPPPHPPPPPPGARVLYLDAEAMPELMNQRAEAWGLDRERLHVMLPARSEGYVDLSLPRHQNLLVSMVYDTQPHFIVVDSLSAISAGLESSVEHVRAILSFLGTVAHEFHAGLLLIHHLRKRGQGQPRRTLITADAFRGSSHITTMARSVLALSVVQTGLHPDANAPRRLEVVKSNLARFPQPLGIVLDSDANPEASVGSTAPDTSPDGNVGHRIPWLRYTAAPEPYRQPTRLELCAEWLVALLREMEQPLRSQEAYALAGEAGFTRATLYRARKSLEGTVLDTERPHSPNNCWKLAPDA